MNGTTFTVFYTLDDVRGSGGRCQTDYRVEKGETIYSKHGRATVRSCITNRAVDATFMGKNARLLSSLAAQGNLGA
jgi:hypothetical protein